MGSLLSKPEVGEINTRWQEPEYTKDGMPEKLLHFSSLEWSQHQTVQKKALKIIHTHSGNSTRLVMHLKLNSF
jgi:hypothetical protein